jgi:hypothetical protein
MPGLTSRVPEVYQQAAGARTLRGENEVIFNLGFITNRDLR